MTTSIKEETDKKKCSLIDEVNSNSPAREKEENNNLISEDTIPAVHSLKTLEFIIEYLCISNDKVYNTSFKIYPKEKKLSFTNKENNITFLEIDLIDFICFSDESYLAEETKKDLKKQFMLTDNTLEEKEICRFTYVPNKQKSKCNCCNCFFCCDCHCKKNYLERNFQISFFLVSRNQISEIEEELRKVNLAIFPVLNDLPSKNRKRKILFFVNPKSGTGISLKIWEKANSFFELCDIDKKVIFTERYKHAYDVVKELKVGEYDAIVNCSGDGILHEVLNAIFHREDREEFLNSITVGALPAGSANGFSKAISDYCGEDNRLETHCYYIAKGITKKIDIQELELRDVEKKVYSFLSLYYGFVADADLESEV